MDSKSKRFTVPTKQQNIVYGDVVKAEEPTIEGVVPVDGDSYVLTVGEGEDSPTTEDLIAFIIKENAVPLVDPSLGVSEEIDGLFTWEEDDDAKER